MDHIEPFTDEHGWRWCGVCGLRPVHAKGRCQPCYRYEARTGFWRPGSLDTRRERPHGAI